MTAEIEIRHISKVFNSNVTFILKYFSPLPQSYGKTSNPLTRSTSLSTNTKMSTLGSAEVLDANVFSPPSKSKKGINLSSKVLDMEAGMKTPGAIVKLNSILEEDVAIQETNDDASYNEPHCNNVNDDEDSNILENRTEAVTQQEPLVQTLPTQSPKGTNLILEN